MVPIANVPHAEPEADLWPTLEVLERSGQDALVIGSGEPEVLLMTRRSAARLIHERAQEHVRRKKLADSLVGFGKRRQPAAPVEPPARIPPDASRPRSDEADGSTGAEPAPDQDDADGERR
jgi:hypothetical protein